MEEKFKRIIAWKNGKKNGPYKIQFNPTNKCNLNCVPCVARGKAIYNPSEEVSKERYIELIQEAAKLGVTNCDICGGGEPFARLDTTLAMMKEIKKNNMIGTIMTNGTLFTEDSIKEIINMNWDHINFSLDGSNEKINDSLRGKGTFIKIMNAIKLFNTYKKKLKQEKPFLSIYSITNKKNYLYTEELVALAKQYEIDGLYFQPVAVSDGKGDSLIMSKEDVEEFKKITSKIRKQLEDGKIKSNIEFIDKYLVENTDNTLEVRKKDAENKTEEKKGNKKEKQEEKNKLQHEKEISISCFSPWMMLVIRADGIVGPCPPGVEYPAFAECNVKDKSLKEIWFGKEFNDFRSRMVQQDEPECCNNCGSMEVIANREILKRIEKE